MRATGLASGGHRSGERTEHVSAQELLQGACDSRVKHVFVNEIVDFSGIHSDENVSISLRRAKTFSWTCSKMNTVRSRSGR